MTTFIDPRAKLFGHLPRLALLQQGGAPPPINVEIDLSNRCSLGCEWCHFAYTHSRGPLKGKRAKPEGAIPGGDLMDTDLALSIVDQLAAAGVASITWTGGGEPTLHPDFDKIIAHASGKLEQGIYTHGGHIDGRRAELMKRRLRFVYVSLDAADAESYKTHKGVDRFAAACSGIRKLAAAPGDATIGVGYLVTKDNYRHANRAIRLAKDLGADYIQFRPTILYESASPNEVAEQTSWLTDAVQALQAAVASWQTTDPGFQVLVDFDRFAMYRAWQGHTYSTCWWSGLQTCITPNGKVWTCVNKREYPGGELGDLSVEAFADVWARRPLANVDGSCRVMCRGHIPNLALDEMMAMRDNPHAAFV